MIGIEPTGAAVEAKVLLAEGGVLAARSAPVVGTVAARRVQRTGRDADAAVEAQVAADVGAAAERVAADAGPVVGAAAQRPAAHQHARAAVLARHAGAVVVHRRRSLRRRRHRRRRRRLSFFKQTSTQKRLQSRHLHSTSICF